MPPPARPERPIGEGTHRRWLWADLSRHFGQKLERCESVDLRDFKHPADLHGSQSMPAAIPGEFRGLTRFTKADDSKPDEGYVIIDDFTTATLPIVDPVDLRERIVVSIRPGPIARSLRRAAVRNAPGS